MMIAATDNIHPIIMYKNSQIVIVKMNKITL